MTSRRVAAATAVLAAICAIPAFSQGRGGADWSTGGGDAQRSGSIRTDPKISPATMGKPGFQLAWSVKLRNDSKQGSGLSEPSLMDRYIGYRGFRSYAFVGGSGDNVFALDSDLARIEWSKHFPTTAQVPLTAPAGTAACPGGMTASVVRPVSAAMANPNAGLGGGGGRGGPAKSGVGEPLQGAVTLAALTAPAAGRAAAGPGRGPAANQQQRPRRMPSMLNAVSSDGAFHSLYVSNGEEPELPIKFLPANAKVSGLIIVDDVAYAVTSGNCGGAPNAIWALDTASKAVASYKADIVGAPAFGPDGVVYVATVDGDLLALEPKTLVKKASYSAGQAFASPAVLFLNGEKPMVAATTKDGTILVLDAGLSTVAAKSSGAKATGTLSTWQDAAGARWIAAPSGKAVAAWKFNGAGLDSAWTSKEIAAPLAPAIVNGVLFTAAVGGTDKATLYALDAATGKEFWNSGSTITSPVGEGGGLAIGGSTVYLGTKDGTLWAFGFPIEH